MDTTYSGNNNLLPLGLFLLLVCVVIAFVGVGYWNSQQSYQYVLEEYGQLTVEQIRILEVLSGHAWENHGLEVNKTFDCFNKYGSKKSFKTFGFIDSDGSPINTNVWLCFDPKIKEWYILVTTAWNKVGGNQVARLLTAYKMSRDLYPTVQDYVNYLELQWGAVVINYIIPAERILLEPK